MDVILTFLTHRWRHSDHIGIEVPRADLIHIGAINSRPTASFMPALDLGFWRKKNLFLRQPLEDDAAILMTRKEVA